MSHVEKNSSSIGRFFRKLLVFIRNYFVLVGVLVTVLPLASIFVLSRQAKRTPSTVELSAKEPVSLTLNLSGSLAEKEPGFAEILFQEIFGDRRAMYLPEIRAALRNAAQDERISGLKIEMGSLQGSPAEYAELRRLLLDFRSSGKELHVLLNEAYDWNYYIASAASRLTLNPTSSLIIPGPSFDLVYVGDALKKLGVDIYVLRAGKYKSAFEPLVANTPSEATLEQYRSMEQSLRDHIIGLVAESRQKAPAVVRGWYERSIFTPEEAVQEGLADAIGYDDEDKSTEPGRPAAVTLADYKTVIDAEGPRGKNVVVTNHGGIALIEATGEIQMDNDQMSASDSIMPARMRREIEWARKNTDVKAVVLRVASPGGSATASDIIWNDLRKLAADKPLVVSMGQYAASGGYYISVPARRIIAEPTTITGSIGVIGMVPNLSAFDEKYGVSFYTVTQSARVKLFNLGDAPTDEDKALMAKTTDQVYHTFVSRVADGRKLAVEDVERLAQGRVYTGLEALKLGLVDELGGLPTAFTAAKQLAGLDVDSLYPILRYRSDRLSLRECMTGPVKFMRCLDAGNVRASVKQQIASALSHESGLGDKEAALATGVKRLLTKLPKYQPLVYWPGYLTQTLR